MIARRRWPKPTLPSANKPSPSGPRCATASVMRRRTTGDTAVPSPFTIPAMPHTCSVPHCPDGEAALLRVEAINGQTGCLTPAAHLVFGVPVRVARVMPVEIDVVVFFERQVGIPERLQEVPVDQPLD